MTTSVRNLRLTFAESVYVLVVAVLGIVGFTAGSAPVILLAALLSLPSSVLEVPIYYVAYGLLGMVPGANPSSSTGSGSCTLNGDCVTSTTGELAPWFAITSEAIGILALVAAALVNVALLRRLNNRRAARV
ncbi:MAG: hypothetical protein WBL35_03955 [Ornithinibacter sp.]